MNVQEVDKYEKAIIENAKQWALGRDCLPLYQEDIAIVCSYIGMNIPKAFYHFVKTDRLESIQADGSYKTIFKTLDVIRQKLLTM